MWTASGSSASRHYPEIELPDACRSSAAAADPVDLGEQEVEHAVLSENSGEQGLNNRPGAPMVRVERGVPDLLEGPRRVHVTDRSQPER